VCVTHALFTVAAPVNSSNSPWHGVDFTHFSSRRDPVCHIDGLECSRMDDEHWKTAPFWTRMLSRIIF